MPEYTPTDELVGKSFPFSYLGEPIRFTIVRLLGDLAFAVADENKWGINERPFSVSEVRVILFWQSTFTSAKEETEDFWESTEVGQVLHYDEGISRLIRGTVVIDPEDGTKKLQLMELIGDWSFEEPHREKDGSVRKSHYIIAVEEKKMVVPSSESIWENLSPEVQSGPRFRDLEGDPATLAPWTYTIPELTEDEIKNAQREKIIASLIETLNNWSETTDHKVDDIRAAIIDLEKI